MCFRHSLRAVISTAKTSKSVFLGCRAKNEFVKAVCLFEVMSKCYRLLFLEYHFHEMCQVLYLGEGIFFVNHRLVGVNWSLKINIAASIAHICYLSRFVEEKPLFEYKISAYYVKGYHGHLAR